MKEKKEKKRMKGRGKIAKKLRRAKKNIVDENTVKLKELKEQEKMEKMNAAESAGIDDDGDEAPAALKRFM